MIICGFWTVSLRRRQTTKMKVSNFVVLLLFLTVQRSSLKVSSIQQGVGSFVIERRLYSSDIFTLDFTGDFKCINDSQGTVTHWCNSLNADYNSQSTGRKSCSCACKDSFRTFLPQKQMCVNSTEAASFGNCKSYFEDWRGNTLLYRSIKLEVENPVDFKVNADYCYIVSGHFFDYSSFQIGWKSICDQIFSFDNRSHKVEFQWDAGKAKKLSGRIIRLKVTCYSSSAGAQSPDTRCMLFKALGTVTYDLSASSVVQSTCPTVSSSALPSPSFPLSPSASPPSASPPTPTPSLLPSLSTSPSLLLPGLSSASSSSLKSATVSLVFIAVTRTLGSTPTGILSFFSSTHTPTRLLSNMRSTLVTSKPTVSTSSRMELQSSLPIHSVEASSQVVSKDIPNTIISTVRPFPIEPSKPSLATKAASSSATIAGPGNKKARTSGNDDGVVIGAAVGGAVVFGIFVVMIIVFCKRRKLWKNKEKATKLEVKNPVYGSSDIPLSTPKENEVMASSETESQPTYQGLIINNSQMNHGSALYSSPEDNYDNYTVYQSLDKKIPETPVYESLKKGQVVTGKPKPSATGHASARSIVVAEPVYNVLEQPDAEQGTMPEKDYWDPEHDDHGETQDPLYNVLDGPDAEQNYEAPDVGDPLYNVLEGSESKQGPQEPVYNVLESTQVEDSPPGTQGPYDGSNIEPLYNVLEGPESDGPNKGGAGYAAPNGSTSPGAHDNPTYEETLQLDVPYASVHKPGSQRESVYEPLRGSGTQDLYERISKRGT